MSGTTRTHGPLADSVEVDGGDGMAPAGSVRNTAITMNALKTETATEWFFENASMPLCPNASRTLFRCLVPQTPVPRSK